MHGAGQQIKSIDCPRNFHADRPPPPLRQMARLQCQRHQRGVRGDPRRRHDERHRQPAFSDSLRLGTSSGRGGLSVAASGTYCAVPGIRRRHWSRSAICLDSGPDCYRTFQEHSTRKPGADHGRPCPRDPPRLFGPRPLAAAPPTRPAQQRQPAWRFPRRPALRRQDEARRRLPRARHGERALPHARRRQHRPAHARRSRPQPARPLDARRPFTRDSGALRRGEAPDAPPRHAHRRRRPADGAPAPSGQSRCAWGSSRIFRSLSLDASPGETIDRRSAVAASNNSNAVPCLRDRNLRCWRRFRYQIADRIC